MPEMPFLPSFNHSILTLPFNADIKEAAKLLFFCLVHCWLLPLHELSCIFLNAVQSDKIIAFTYECFLRGCQLYLFKEKKLIQIFIQNLPIFLLFLQPVFEILNFHQNTSVSTTNIFISMNNIIENSQQTILLPGIFYSCHQGLWCVITPRSWNTLPEGWVSQTFLNLSAAHFFDTGFQRRPFEEDIIDIFISIPSFFPIGFGIMEILPVSYRDPTKAFHNVEEKHCWLQGQQSTKWLGYTKNKSIDFYHRFAMAVKKLQNKEWLTVKDKTLFRYYFPFLSFNW